MKLPDKVTVDEIMDILLKAPPTAEFDVSIANPKGGCGLRVLSYEIMDEEEAETETEYIVSKVDGITILKKPCEIGYADFVYLEI